MAHQIIIEFPTEKIANEFCDQMSDGSGENLCDFSHHRQKPGTDGTKNEHYEEVHDDKGRRTYFVSDIFEQG